MSEWHCPTCGITNSPHVDECVCCGQEQPLWSTSGPTDDQLRAVNPNLTRRVMDRNPGKFVLYVDPPKMAHGDGDRMADMCGQVGVPLVPWQREFLNRMESASMDKQFGEIVRDELT